MTTSEESFLARWSRLKRQTAEPDIAESEAAERGAVEARPAMREGDATAGHDAAPGVRCPSEESSDPAAQPVPDFKDFDFDSLDFSSDYRQFMREGVPHDVRNKALRQLWASDPVFSTLDGLDDCCGDYTDAAMVPKTAVVTAYKVGRGFLSDSEVREWEALGRPIETEIAAADDAEADGDEAAETDSGSSRADAASAASEGEFAEEHEETAGASGPSADTAATDAIDTAACPGAACAAVVKKEEQEALASYERPARTGKAAADA